MPRSRGRSSATATPTITVLICALASSTLLTYPQAASSHEISRSGPGDFSPMQRAWADVSRSMLNANAPEPYSGDTRTCRAKIIYSTSVFIDQAYYAADLIYRTPLANGTRLRIEISEVTHINDIYGYNPSAKSDPKDAFIQNSKQLSDSDFCIVLAELPMPEDINGMGWMCRMCGENNVAGINILADDALTFSVIMHEIGHLLCARHNDAGGVMRPFTYGDSLLGTFSGLAIGKMSEAWQRGDEVCSSRQWAGKQTGQAKTTQSAAAEPETKSAAAEPETKSAAAEPETKRAEDTSAEPEPTIVVLEQPRSLETRERRCRNCRTTDYWDWSDADTAAAAFGFFILFFLLLVLMLPLCLFYETV